MTPPSTAPANGAWHALHLFLRIEGKVPDAARARLAAAAGGEAGGGILRSAAWGVLGARADLGLLLFAADARDLHRWQVSLFAEAERSLARQYGFASLTEVSEYVPAERRTPELIENRLHPSLSAHPNLCFYPMSKRREEERNWYRLPLAERARLMRGHGESARKFAGRISQIITTSAGLDDWEWGVTLFGATPEDIRDCVYEMRFDAVSADYALFGDFYYGPRLDAAAIEENLPK